MNVATFFCFLGGCSYKTWFVRVPQRIVVVNKISCLENLQPKLLEAVYQILSRLSKKRVRYLDI